MQSVKKHEKISNFRHGTVIKYGVVLSKRWVSPTSSCGRALTYVKEVKKFDLMPFVFALFDKAHQSAKFLFILSVLSIQFIKKLHVTLLCAILRLDKDFSLGFIHCLYT